MTDLLALDLRVNRLEELELRHARVEARTGTKSPEPNSAKSPVQLSAPGSPKLDMPPVSFLSSSKVRVRVRVGVRVRVSNPNPNPNQTSFLTMSPKADPNPGPSLSSLGLPVALNDGSAG